MPTSKQHYQVLKDKWTSQHRKLQKSLWVKHRESFEWLTHHSKQFAVGSMGGLMLLTSSGNPLATPVATPDAIDQGIERLDKKAFVKLDLSSLLPSEVRPLSSEEEQKVTDSLSKHFGVKVAAELEGKRLERNYGIIGAEQHLARYAGDSMTSHFDLEEDAKQYWSSGMAPGRGGWGYFVQGPEITEQDKLREKYYIAVQTFLAPGFSERTKEYMDFFKFRKMLVVNPENGKAIVADIGDSGPAVWTGKHLGGSPEVMQYLERVDGSRRGTVLYFFIDDPQDKIPLGPIEPIQ